jgi:hypothetical protein
LRIAPPVYPNRNPANDLWHLWTSVRARVCPRVMPRRVACAPLAGVASCVGRAPLAGLAACAPLVGLAALASLALLAACAGSAANQDFDDRSDLECLYGRKQ